MRIPIKQLLEIHIRGKIIDEKRGASGVVYLVDNGKNVLPRKIAFKTFQERFQLDEEKRKQFLEECIRWFKLRNPYIVVESCHADHRSCDADHLVIVACSVIC
jgi:hypothetical protein